MSNLNDEEKKEITEEGKNNELIEGMIKTLNNLSNDVNQKKVEIEMIKNKIKEGKFDYNKEVKIYQELNKEIILNEEKKGEIENYISKIKKKKLIFNSSLTKEFLQNLIEGFKKFEEIYIYFITFSGYPLHKDLDFISIILTDEYELKYVIEYSEKYQFNLYENSKEEFELIKNNIIQFKKQNSIPYQFQLIFENMENIYKIIELNYKKNDIINNINKKIEEKNNRFIILKKIEGNIISNEKTFQEMKIYVKNINSILENYQTLKENNDKSNFLKFAKIVNDFDTVNFTSENITNICINNMTLQSEFNIENNSKKSLNDNNNDKKNNNVNIENNNKNNISKLNKNELNLNISIDKNINNKTSKKLKLRSTTPIHSLKKGKISKPKSPNLSLISKENSKSQKKKLYHNKSYLNNLNVPFPLNNLFQKTVIKKKIIKNDLDNEKTERNDNIILNLIRTNINNMIIKDSNVPFSIDNDSVCDEVCPYRNDKFQISSLVIKNENGKIYPIYNKGNFQNNFHDYKIDRKTYSNECCMSCT